MGNTSSQRRRGKHIKLADTYRDPERLINCLVVGDDESGRDALIMRYLGNEPPTPGAPVVPAFTDKVCYSMIARQRLYNVMLFSVPDFVEEKEEVDWRLYPSPDVIILCLSLVNRQTLKNAKDKWFEDLKRHMPSKKKIPIVVAGTYLELREQFEAFHQDDIRDVYGNELKAVEFNEGSSFANEIDAVVYVECNLDNGFGVEKAFYEAAKATHKRIPLGFGVHEQTVMHRDSVALKRYNYQHTYLVSQKMFLESDQGDVLYGL